MRRELPIGASASDQWHIKGETRRRGRLERDEKRRRRREEIEREREKCIKTTGAERRGQNKKNSV